MIAKMIPKEIAGRLLMPSIIFFMASVLTPVAVFIIPSASQLRPAFFSEPYSFTWQLPIISGIMLLVIVMILWGRKK